jgi:hypothetical protein
MLSVVCWKWTPQTNYRSKFNAEHVNTFARMVKRHFHAPHEIVCVTDNWKGIDESVRIVKIWDNWARIPSPHGGMNPSCYRRLKAFDSAMAHVLGKRFISVDLDVVITGDVTPLWNRTEDFVIWGDQLKGTPYNGSMWLMTAGARHRVYAEFDPESSPQQTLRARLLGSDQAWISHVLGTGEATWTREDGVYAFRTDIRRNHMQLPKNAKIVFFQGNVDPWHPLAQKLPWVQEHYR